MSCKDFETKIYLYSELSANEKELLDSHLQTCQACSVLLEEMKQTQELIHRVAEEKVMPSNSARLTSGIMSAIISDRQTSTVSLVDRVFIRARFAMTVLSICLLIFFAVEFLNEPSPTAPKVIPGSSVLLIGKAFRLNFLTARSERAFFSDCRSPFQSGKEYLNCVKSKLK